MFLYYHNDLTYTWNNIRFILSFGEKNTDNGEKEAKNPIFANFPYITSLKKKWGNKHERKNIWNKGSNLINNGADDISVCNSRR